MSDNDELDLIELFQILYRENLFGLLSEKNYTLGKELLETKFAIELGDLQNMGLKFTIDDHLKIASEVLDISEKTTDFWKIVVKINYIMMAIERNPIVAGELEDLKRAIK